LDQLASFLEFGTVVEEADTWLPWLFVIVLSKK
jgi:hypothetical protein